MEGISAKVWRIVQQYKKLGKKEAARPAFHPAPALIETKRKEGCRDWCSTKVGASSHPELSGVVRINP